MVPSPSPPAGEPTVRPHRPWWGKRLGQPQRANLGHGNDRRQRQWRFRLRALAQIGHGGGTVNGNLSGDIFVNRDPLTMAPVGGGLVRVAAVAIPMRMPRSASVDLPPARSPDRPGVWQQCRTESRFGPNRLLPHRCGGGVDLTAAITGYTSVQASVGGSTWTRPVAAQTPMRRLVREVLEDRVVSTAAARFRPQWLPRVPFS